MFIMYPGTVVCDSEEVDGTDTTLSTIATKNFLFKLHLLTDDWNEGDSYKISFWRFLTLGKFYFYIWSDITIVVLPYDLLKNSPSREQLFFTTSSGYLNTYCLSLSNIDTR